LSTRHFFALKLIRLEVGESSPVRGYSCPLKIGMQERQIELRSEYIKALPANEKAKVADISNPTVPM
ncbi:MAG: hypothetical protein MJH10_16410, partial [Epibacterium sp.]|nr:hypothetical protein [Epibacterium sp.]